MKSAEFIESSKIIGGQLLRFESEEWNLARGTDADHMLKRSDIIGDTFGLNEYEKTQAVIQGGNAARGDVNEVVSGFKVGK